MISLTILGTIGRDPEVRTTQSGQKVTNLSVACDSGFGDNKTTIWVRASMWGKRGETLAEHTSKGQQICLTGQMSLNEYNGKTYVELNATDFSFVRGQKPKEAAQDAPPPATDLDDEIPF